MGLELLGGERMRIGIYGGTFDPVHLGHLILAETIRESLSLDEVRFVPAFVNPHKQGRPVTPPKLRLEMLRFALAGNAGLRLSEIEIKRKGPSYTYETLEAIAAEHPEAELFLLVGADSLDDFPKWREPERILDLATLVAVNRGRESPVIPSTIDPDRVLLTSMPAIDISASEIRERAQASRSIRYLTPRAVELFIQSNQLYLEQESENS